MRAHAHTLSHIHTCIYSPRAKQHISTWQNKTQIYSQCKSRNASLQLPKTHSQSPNRLHTNVNLTVSHLHFDTEVTLHNRVNIVNSPALPVKLYQWLLGRTGFYLQNILNAIYEKGVLLFHYCCWLVTSFILVSFILKKWPCLTHHWSTR